MENKFKEYTIVKHKLTGEELLILSSHGMGMSYVTKIRVRNNDYEEFILDINEVE